MTHMLPIDGDYLDKNLILIITIEKLEINIDIMVHPIYFRQSFFNTITGVYGRKRNCFLNDKFNKESSNDLMLYK